MSAVKRFFYVRSPRSHLRHRVFTKNMHVIEGDKTACGIVVPTHWKLAGSDKQSALARCRRCEKADAPD